jgi:hypothetical protein
MLMTTAGHDLRSAGSRAECLAAEDPAVAGTAAEVVAEKQAEIRPAGALLKHTDHTK